MGCCWCNKRKSEEVDTFMEEEMEKCKIFRNLGGWKENFGGKRKVRRKSVISENEIFLESLNPPSQIPAYATAIDYC